MNCKNLDWISGLAGTASILQTWFHALHNRLVCQEPALACNLSVLSCGRVAHGGAASALFGFFGDDCTKQACMAHGACIPLFHFPTDTYYSTGTSEVHVPYTAKFHANAVRMNFTGVCVEKGNFYQLVGTYPRGNRKSRSCLLTCSVQAALEWRLVAFTCRIHFPV